jgi:hypothetical protein
MVRITAPNKDIKRTSSIVYRIDLGRHVSMTEFCTHLKGAVNMCRMKSTKYEEKW